MDKKIVLGLSVLAILLKRGGMNMDKFEQDANEIVSAIKDHESIVKLQEIIIKKLKEHYNRGKGWKRDRKFLSAEEHEKNYAPKRKKPFKTYKKKEG